MKPKGSMEPRDETKIGWISEVKAYEILRSIPDALFITDRQMRIQYFSEAAGAITGFRASEAMGMYCKDVLKSNLCEIECPIKRALDLHQNIFNTESTITTASGQELAALISASLLTAGSGDIVGYLYVFRDVSPLKQMMSDLEKSRDALAEKNEELAKALEELKATQEQLLHAQKMESMGTLAGGVAHDFNNICQAFFGYLELMLEGKDASHPEYRYLTAMREGAERARELIQRLLLFSRRVESALRPVDLNAEVRQVHTLLSRMVPKTITIELRLDPELNLINADRSQLTQIMMNLGVNAVDAMPEGGTLVFQTRNAPACSGFHKHSPSPRPGSCVVLAVSDSGCGMDKRTQERIFEPFFTTKGPGRGTGLGLSMVYGIVQSHGGSVTCSSEPGKGARFEVFFPALPAPGRPETAARRQSDPEALGGRETVLLVDDERALTDIGRQMLESQGYTVLTAWSGESALEIFARERHRIDLVILDLGMPGIGGHKCLRGLLRADPAVKVIVASGYADTSRAQEILKDGACAFVAKPYRLSDMLAQVRAVLDRKTSAMAE